MLGSDRIAARFNALSVLGQSCLIVAVAAAGADLLTLVFYSIFFSDRLVLDLLLTSVIVLFVASPLSYFFLKRSAQFAELAAELEKADRTDELTGLLNRKTFLAKPGVLLGRGERTAQLVRCCSSMRTISRRSTTASVMQLAMRSCGKSALL
jgi:hypothetical protein